MHVDEKSDSGVVPAVKPPNNEGHTSVDGVEGRLLPEGNSDQTAAAWTQSRVTASILLMAVCRAEYTVWMRGA
jgi:hypothetical protein